jgi:hypothetical protein
MLKRSELVSGGSELLGELSDMLVFLVDDFPGLCKRSNHVDMFSTNERILQQLFFKNIPFIHFFWDHSLKEKT